MSAGGRRNIGSAEGTWAACSKRLIYWSEVAELGSGATPLLVSGGLTSAPWLLKHGQASV